MGIQPYLVTMLTVFSMSQVSMHMSCRRISILCFREGQLRNSSSSPSIRTLSSSLQFRFFSSSINIFNINYLSFYFSIPLQRSLNSIPLQSINFIPTSNNPPTSSQCISQPFSSPLLSSSLAPSLALLPSVTTTPKSASARTSKSKTVAASAVSTLPTSTPIYHTKTLQMSKASTLPVS